MKKIDLTGVRFDMLLIMHEVESTNGHAQWL